MLALGIESESEEIRKDMVKRLEKKKIETAFGNMRDAGIKSFAFFIYGYPGETIQTMDQTTKYAIELDPDFANFYPAVPYPGTALYEKCVRDGLLRPEDADWSRMEYLPAPRQRHRRPDRDGLDQPRQAAFLRPYQCGADDVRLACGNVVWQVLARSSAPASSTPARPPGPRPDAHSEVLGRDPAVGRRRPTRQRRATARSNPAPAVHLALTARWEDVPELTTEAGRRTSSSGNLETARRDATRAPGRAGSGWPEVAS
jgi:hypothetical protein